MELGFEFMGASTTFSIGASYEAGLVRDASAVATISQEMEYETTCSAEGQEGTGLWQWVVRTEDSSIIARGEHTVCKTGEGFNIAPRCPWTACVDGQCRQCRAGWMTQ